MILMEVLDKHGNTLAACGEKCYDGFEIDTECICLGTNFNVGIQEAARNIHNNAKQLLLAWRQCHVTAQPEIVRIHKGLRLLAQRDLGPLQFPQNHLRPFSVE